MTNKSNENRMNLNDNFTCYQCPVYQKSAWKSCDVDGICTLFANKILLQLKKGELLFKENQSTPHIYCVLDGLIKVSKKDSRGRNQFIGIYTPGKLLGLHAVFNNMQHSTTAIAIEDSRVCQIAIPVLLDLFDQHPSIAVKCMKGICGEISMVEKRIESLALKTPFGQVVEAILTLSLNYGFSSQKNNKQFIGIIDLLEFTNTSKAKLLKVLNILKKKNIIRFESNGIHVLDSRHIQELVV